MKPLNRDPLVQPWPRQRGMDGRVVLAAVLTGSLFAASSAMAADPAPAAAAAPAAPCDPYKNYDCLESRLGTGFWERLLNYYDLEDGQAAAPTDPKTPPSRRDDFTPAAQTSPPMPFTEWPYGGTPPLGASIPNAVDSPLMVALGNTSFGKWMSDNHMQTYGWINAGANFTTTTNQHGGNAPAAYSYNPNALALDQIVQYWERVPDMVQKDHNDWGFRVSLIYGQDYRYTTAYGFWSQQYINQNKANGFDAPMVYFDWYTPFVAQGLNIRVGRYISIPDIEAQLAPNNYMYSHSMTYAYDNYTNEGVLASLSFNKNWIGQAGVTFGTEATPMHAFQRVANPSSVPALVSSGAAPNLATAIQYNLYSGDTVKVDPGALPSYTLGVRWTSDDGKDDVNFTWNGQNSGEWGYNNLQWIGFTAYHTFNEKWHVSWEVYNEHQNKVPNAAIYGGDNQFSGILASNSLANGAAYLGPFSPTYFPHNAPATAVCDNPLQKTCRADATGTVIYLNYSWNPLNNLSFRPEIYWDSQGQRTGTKAVYRNYAIGWQHWTSPQLEFRPEIDYMHASSPAFNYNNTGTQTDGIKRSYWMVSGDVIYHW